MALDRPHISVISPVYGCKDCLSSLCDRLDKVLSSISPNYEIILVNDASPDEAWTEIVDLSKKNSKIKGINFSRNFGQHYAISAGFDYAVGDWIIVMDCDLQDQPEEIVKLYNKTKEGFDIVYGTSFFRGKNSFLRTILRKTYFKIYDILAQNNFKTETLSFYIMSADVKNSIILFRESARHISSLLRYVGFKIIGIEIKHLERTIGNSSYSFSKRMALAYTGIIAYSSILLKMSFVLGFLISIFSFSTGIVLIVNKFSGNYAIDGWVSIVTLILFSTGLILSFLGIFGMYLEKMFLEVKNRPLYIIRDKLNL
jgi:glycosyltransferase involved in cell wall biosynthesis